MGDNPFDYTSAPTSRGPKLIDVLQFVVLGAAVMVVLYLFFIIPTQVDGQSMERNYFNDEVLLSNRLLQLVGGPKGLIKSYDYQRGDIVVFMREGQPDLIKRIIALEGERVMIKGNRVYVNGKLLPESYIPADKPTAAGTFIAEGEEKVVPAGSYFALGDNRINSKDSRSADVGFVKREQLRGAPFVRILPLGKFNFIQRPVYEGF